MEYKELWSCLMVTVCDGNTIATIVFTATGVEECVAAQIDESDDTNDESDDTCAE